MTERCPTCQRPLRESRCGVVLTPLKAQIYDLVNRAGDAGIDSRAIIARIGRQTLSAAAVKSHIYQINELIGDNGYLIRSSRALETRWRLLPRQRRS